MKAKGDEFYQRGFINPDDRGGLAAFESKVGGVDQSTGHFDAGLQLSDCSRQITLDFDSYGDADDREALRTKARKLKRVVDTFVAAFLAACDESDNK